MLLLQAAAATAVTTVHPFRVVVLSVGLSLHPTPALIAAAALSIFLLVQVAPLVELALCLTRISAAQSLYEVT
jgi:hypothetical protein